MVSAHDITPACWAALGRRGVSGAMARAERMFPSVVPGTKAGSPNIHLIIALNNAAVHRDYTRARDYLADMRKFGSGEGGPLYGPAGGPGYVASLATLARLDSELVVEIESLKYLAQWRDYAAEIAMPRPSNVLVVRPNGKEYDQADRIPAGGWDVKHVFMGGDRAMFSGTAFPGWYEFGIATSLYNWLIDAEKREIDSRFSGYSPTTPRTWDSWAWLICQLNGWVPATADSQPKTVGKAYRTNSLADWLVGVEPGPYKYRWATEAVKFRSGSQFHTTSHATASPKPPASIIDYDSTDRVVRIYVPDGFTNYGDDGRGWVEHTNRHVWGECHSDFTGATLRTKKRDRGYVVSHRVLRARATQWEDGELHPREPEPRPEPPPDEDDEPSSWVRYRSIAIALALAGLLIWWQGC